MARPLTIDLTEPRTLGSILGVSWRVWRSRPSVFLLIAIAVILPVEILVTGIIGGGFSNPYGEASDDVALIDALIVAVFSSPLISATHARAVVMLSSGKAATTGDVFRAGLATLGAVIVTALIYGLLVLGGTIALIIPGIWLATVGVFTVQVKALTRTPVIECFSSSNDVVGKVGWWRTFGVLVLLWLISSIAGGVMGAIVGGLMGVIDDPSVSGPVGVIGFALLIAAIYSWTALVTTMQYFAWRARAGDPWGAPAEQDPDLERGADWNPSGQTEAAPAL